jgi:hypothetical protein
MDKYRRKLLALSTPRSGSRFFNRVLRNCGVKVGHEGFKPDGLVTSFYAVEDCWYPGKHWTVDEDHPVEDESKTQRSLFEFEQVWHFIRDPRVAIASIASPVFAQNVWCWQERHTGISCGLFPKKLRAMQFWVAWNELIEKNEKIDFQFRIEDIDAQWPEIKSRLGIPADKEFPNMDRDYGTVLTGVQAVQPMTWDEMKSIDATWGRRVREMAECYGYV